MTGDEADVVVVFDAVVSVLGFKMLGIEMVGKAAGGRRREKVLAGWARLLLTLLLLGRWWWWLVVWCG